MVAVETPRRIEGEGTSEPTWQRWLAATPCSELSMAQALAPSQRLVVVAPHPDDEVLACGALVAVHAARGGEVVFVAVTDGEASHAGLSRRAAASWRRSAARSGCVAWRGWASRNRRCTCWPCRTATCRPKAACCAAGCCSSCALAMW